LLFLFLHPSTCSLLSITNPPTIHLLPTSHIVAIIVLPTTLILFCLLFLRIRILALHLPAAAAASSVRLSLHSWSAVFDVSRLLAWVVLDLAFLFLALLVHLLGPLLVALEALTVDPGLREEVDVLVDVELAWKRNIRKRQRG